MKLVLSAHCFKPIVINVFSALLAKARITNPRQRALQIRASGIPKISHSPSLEKNRVIGVDS